MRTYCVGFYNGVNVTGVLINRPFAVFWFANLISGLGDAFRTFTFMLWVYQISDGSGLAIAAIAAAQVLPSVALGVLAGVLADRWERKRILIVCDLARAALSLGLIGAVQINSFWLGLSLLALSTAFSVFADVAGATVLPRLIPDQRLEQGNGLWTIMQQSSGVVGPVLAAIA